MDKPPARAVKFSRFVIVTGLSGAGKSQAMKSFEDFGFHCLDNLPPKLTLGLVELCAYAKIERLALALDVRSHGPFGEAIVALDELRARGITFDLLYLDARDETIVRRYSETRRRHPFEDAGSLRDAIETERKELEPLRKQADRIWDTTDYTHAALKNRIAAAFGDRTREQRLAIVIMSFGFKYGLPVDADLVFDVRFLPNPNYVPALKELNGRDDAVAAFLRDVPASGEFISRINGMIDFLLPYYVEEGKSRLTVAIGCTGGRHRSVYTAERIAEHVRTSGRVELVIVDHRDLHA
jgi:UPF0042 nucleotide-binding protein